MPNTKKTNRDIPLAPTPEAKYTYTNTWQRTKNVQDANEKKGNVVSGIDVKDGKATAKPYEKKFIGASKNRTNAVITDSNNKIVASSKEGSKKSIAELRRSFVNDSTDTMNRRNNTANYYNLISGSKKQLTSKDRKDLLKGGKIKIA